MLSDRQAEQIGTQFENAIALGDSGKHDEAEQIFAQIAADGTSAYRALARMRQAAELAQSDPAAATAAYRRISADGSVEQVLRELAALRAAALLIDAGSYIDARKLLEPLAEPGATSVTARASCSRSLPGRQAIGRERCGGTRRCSPILKRRHRRARASRC